MIKKIYECVHCPEQKEIEIENAPEFIRCPKCGAEMFPLPYDKVEAIIKLILDYVNSYTIRTLTRNQYTLIYENKIKIPSFYTVTSTLSDAKNFDHYFTILTKQLEKIHLYYNENIVSNVKFDFTPLYKEAMLKDKFLIKTCDKLGEEIKLDEIKIPIDAGMYYNNVNYSMIELTNQIINNLFSLSGKIKTIIEENNFYGLDYRKIKSYNKDTNLTELEKIKLLEKTNQKLIDYISAEYIFDIFSDGKKEVYQLINLFFESLDILLKFIQKEEKVTFFIEDKILTEQDIYDIYIGGRYLELDYLINKQKFSLCSYEEMIKYYETLFKDKLNNEIILDNTNEGEAKLNELIGLQVVKENVQKLKAYLTKNKQNKNLDNINLHMAFYGNPGTGKTEVARIIAQILYENKILPTNKLIEVDRQGLVGQYVGETPYKVDRVVKNAIGGVLFIDEAYSLVPNDASFDYGHEAVAALIKAMEDNRGKFCVILAGYKNPLMEMIDSNPGFKSRIQFHIDFPNYSREELGEILNLMLNKKQYIMEKNAYDKCLDITDILRKNANFANAREIRNMLDQIIMNQNIRSTIPDDFTILEIDVDKYIKDSKIPLPKKQETNQILSADEELEQLIGLDNVKKMIKKIKAFAIRNKDNNLNMHMAFYGNPGTGKTEVARIISRLLHEVGVLEEAKLIETDSSGLISKYVGDTSRKTQELINNSLGGVLFIDEAYALSTDNTTNSYGEEAIAVLLKEMEDKRGKFCVILAGYKEPMSKMLSTNPGFKSRIMFNIEFPDYTIEELKEIALFILKKKEYTITTEALNLISLITEQKRKQPDFANAREIRNIIDQVILNQNLREEDINNNEIIIDDVIMYIEDEKIEIDYQNNNLFNNHKINIDEIINQSQQEFEFNSEYIEQTIVSISKNNSQGTGFIISKDGYILTCAHCVTENIMNVRVDFIIRKNQKIKTYYEAELIQIDEKNDIALLKILEDNIEFNYLPISINEEYKPLENVLMIGYPFGGETYQEVSYFKGQILSKNIINQDRQVIFVDISGKPGSSGSPVISNKTNKVIGVYFGGISSNNEMINCFTPIEHIWKLLKK